MFVSLRTEGHKHGVSIQSSTNLGDTVLQITREWKTAGSWVLARLFICPSSIVSQILDLKHWMVTIFILITWLVKTENSEKNRLWTLKETSFQRYCCIKFWTFFCFILSVSIAFHSNVVSHFSFSHSVVELAAFTFDDGDMSPPKRHVFISLLFILKCFSNSLVIRTQRAIENLLWLFLLSNWS